MVVYVYGTRDIYGARNYGCACPHTAGYDDQVAWKRPAVAEDHAGAVCRRWGLDSLDGNAGIDIYLALEFFCMRPDISSSICLVIRYGAASRTVTPAP